jgi:GDPmannose 4,6-dehydratase
MNKKKAFITGITGQDGAYLAEFLLGKNYEVYGGYRSVSAPNYWRIEELGIKDKIKLCEIDILEASNLIKLINTIRPDEIYNLAAQSYVSVSFQEPILTANASGLSVVYLLEAIRIVDPKIKFFQASTSEFFGHSGGEPLTEQSKFYPQSPYAAAKLFAYCMMVNYRDSYNIFACSGILFNHESPLRGADYVTRKISNAVARIHLGLQKSFEIGNMYVMRDWGYSREYVESMWRIMQMDKPDDFVIATGKAHSIKDFIEQSFKVIKKDVVWKGSGVDEKCIDKQTGEVLVSVNPAFFRPCDLQITVGDSSKAKKILGWEYTTDFYGLVELMVKKDIERNSVATHA